MIILDGGKMPDRQALHAQLKEKLGLPDYYGNNLDALNDCLSERVERELIVVEHASDMIEGCEDYALGLLRVFSDNGIQVLLD